MVSEAKGVMYIPVWVDDGVIKPLVLDSGAIPITETNPLTVLQSKAYGYIGGAWQKQPMMWGITERWVESLDLTCDSSGFVLVRTTAVDAGYIHVVEAVACKLSQRQTTSVSMECRGNSINVPLNAAATLAANTFLFWAGRASMQDGDQIQIYMGGTQNNDTFVGRVWGYKMKVDD